MILSLEHESGCGYKPINGVNALAKEPETPSGSELGSLGVHEAPSMRAGRTQREATGARK